MHLSQKDTYQVNTGEYLIQYTIQKNFYSNGTKENVYEYGIECTLTNSQGEALSEEQIRYISPNYHHVAEIVQILKKYEVFPAHLKEILVDILNMTPTEKANLLSV